MEQPAGAATSEGSDRRTWLVGAIVVAALVALAATAVLLVGNREDVTYEPGSPEAVVQAYARAWEAGDADAAYQLLTPRAQERVDRHEYRYAASWEEDLPSRIWVQERVDHDDRVVITLAVEMTWDGLLGPDRETHDLRLTLIPLDDGWRIDTPVVGFYPW
ncbi:MAG: hypothetical protein PVG27_11610 [Chloroflexota bacterium]|jgi:hypothetical protein